MTHDDHVSNHGSHDDTDDPLAGYPPSPPCRKTGAGHQVHFIQVRLSHRNEPELLFLSDFEVSASGLFVLTTWEGRQVRLFNHDPRRVHRLLDDTWNFLRDEPIEWVDPALLQFPSATNAHPCVSAVTPDKATECNQRTVQDLLDDVVRGNPIDEEDLRATREPEPRDLDERG